MPRARIKTGGKGKSLKKKKKRKKKYMDIHSINIYIYLFNKIKSLNQVFLGETVSSSM